MRLIVVPKTQGDRSHSAWNLPLTGARLLDGKDMDR